jgi:hypothetical protein
MTMETAAPAAGSSAWESITLVEASALRDDLIVFGQQLAWLCAVFRSPVVGDPPSRPDCSDVSFIHTGSNTFTVQVFQRPMSDKEQLCWCPLFKHFSIALGFPIPDRAAQQGLELPLDLMQALSQVWYPLQFRNSVIFKGNSTALVPISRGDDFIQWHLIGEVQGDPLELDVVKRKFHEASVEITPEMIEKSGTRHFLGLWRQADIHIGTTSYDYQSFNASASLKTGLNDESSRIHVARELTANLGLPKVGGPTLGSRFFWHRPVRIDFEQDNRVLNDLTITSKERASLLYDPSTQIAWFVPEVVAIYHSILIWAARSGFLSKLPMVNPQPCPEEAIIAKWKTHEETELEPKKGRQEAITLGDIVRTMYRRFEGAKLNAEVQSREGKAVGKKVSYGYSIDHIIHGTSDEYRKEISIQPSSGGWENIAEENPKILILICRDLGLPIRPHDTSQLCDTWNPCPAGKDYLIASVPSIIHISPGETLQLSPRHICRRRRGALPFEPCPFSNQACDRLQELSTRFRKDTLRASDPPEHGAIIFGKKHIYQGKPCKPLPQSPQQPSTRTVEQDIPSAADWTNAQIDRNQTVLQQSQGPLPPSIGPCYSSNPHASSPPMFFRPPSTDPGLLRSLQQAVPNQPRGLVPIEPLRPSLPIPYGFAVCGVDRNSGISQVPFGPSLRKRPQCSDLRSYFRPQLLTSTKSASDMPQPCTSASCSLQPPGRNRGHEEPLEECDGSDIDENGHDHYCNDERNQFYSFDKPITPDNWWQNHRVVSQGKRKQQLNG